MKKKRILISGAILLVILITFLYTQNNLLSTTEVIIKSPRVPSNFNDFKILQISDLHNKEFGKNQNILVKEINKISPDIIVITGDFIDSRRYDEEKSLKLIEELSNIYPIYFVSGNHESRTGRFNELENKLKENNVTVLRNKYITLKKQGQSISIIGIDDPTFSPNMSYMDSYMEGTKVSDNIKSITSNINSDEFKILLSHRPELFEVYVEADIDLVFSGHAHGGQIIIPFIGGVIAPGQGLFPTYTDGLYEENNTKMLVSRGLGNSIFPQRIFNRPNIVVATLSSK